MRNRLLLGAVAAVVLGAQAHAQVAPEAAPIAQAAPVETPAAAPAVTADAPVATPVAPVTASRGVIVMDRALQDQLVTKLHPNSFTGAATSLSFPIGAAIRDAALKTLAISFADGVEVAEAGKPEAYSIALRLDGFAYKYDSMSSLGFAITPRVTVKLMVDVTGPDGKALFRKAYSREDFTAGAYVATFKPKEKVIGSLEKALVAIFSDVQTDLANPPTSDTTVAATPAT